MKRDLLQHGPADEPWLGGQEICQAKAEAWEIRQDRRPWLGGEGR